MHDVKTLLNFYFNHQEIFITKLITTLGGTSLESFYDLFPLGNVPHEINGKG